MYYMKLDSIDFHLKNPLKNTVLAYSIIVVGRLLNTTSNLHPWSDIVQAQVILIRHLCTWNFISLFSLTSNLLLQNY